MSGKGWSGIQNPFIGSATPGASALASALMGGQFNTVLPILVNGQQCALQFDSRGRLITAGTILDPLPAAEIRQDTAVNPGKTEYKGYTADQKLAIKQFYAGGTGLGKQTLWRHIPANSQFLQYGDFESSGDVAAWTVVDPGLNLPVVSYSTDQKYTGTGSAKIVFTKSAGNDYTGLKRTFSPSMDVTGWKQITAAFYNSPPAGGAVTRTISIVLTDSSGATRVYSVSGLTSATPFNASGWIQIVGDIRNPTSVSGTSFDGTDVVSLELKMVDSGNKSGTIYWDSVVFKEQMTMIFPIFHQEFDSVNLPIDPVKILDIGDKILITQTSFDTLRKEYFAFAGAVSIS